MEDVTITKLEDNVFCFECEDGRVARKIKALREFEYKGVKYKVKNIHVGMEIGGFYCSYTIVTE